MGFTLWLSALAAAGFAPAPVSAPAAVPAVAATEEEQWAMVRKADSAPAYQLYLRRFPAGVHRTEAEAAFLRIKGIDAVPPSPASRGTWQVVDPPYDKHAVIPRSGAPNQKYVDDPCIRQRSFDAPEDVAAYLDVRARNRIEDYREYLDAFPNGICRQHAQVVLEARAKRARELPRIAGLGPLPPHPLRATAIAIDDYPASAMRRDETGTVTAEWDVAADGSVEMCRVVASSGSRDLDETTCRLITLRMIYDPARPW